MLIWKLFFEANHNQSGGIQFSQEVIRKSQPCEAYPMTEPILPAQSGHDLYSSSPDRKFDRCIGHDWLQLVILGSINFYDMPYYLA